MPTSLPSDHKPLIVIDNNPGGLLQSFRRARSQMDLEGSRYAIKGFCMSSCAFFLTRLKHVCALKGAKLGYHAVYNPTTLLVYTDETLDLINELQPQVRLLAHRYQIERFGFFGGPVPYTWDQKEPGVAIYNVRSEHGLYQRFLMVDATKVVAACN